MYLNNFSKRSKTFPHIHFLIQLKASLSNTDKYLAASLAKDWKNLDLCVIHKANWSRSSVMLLFEVAATLTPLAS